MDFALAQIATPDIVAEYLKLGVLGLTAAAAIWWAIKKDAELTAERKARLEDAKAAVEIARTSSESLTKWTIAQEAQNKQLGDMARALERLVSK